MGKAIILGHTKGGVGKSTLSLNIADFIASRKLKVILVDIDKMRGNTKLRELFGKGRAFDFEVLDLSASKSITKDILALKAEHDFVVVDCPPSKDSDAMSQACKAGDLLLVPYRPNPMDYIELTEMDPFLVEVKKVNPALRGASIANLVDTPPTLLSESVMQSAKSSPNLPALDGFVSRRSFFTTCQAEARGVSSVRPSSPSDKKSLDEIEKLMEQIIQCLK